MLRDTTTVVDPSMAERQLAIAKGITSLITSIADRLSRINILRERLSKEKKSSKLSKYKYELDATLYNYIDFNVKLASLLTKAYKLGMTLDYIIPSSIYPGDISIKDFIKRVEATYSCTLPLLESLLIKTFKDSQILIALVDSFKVLSDVSLVVKKHAVESLIEYINKGYSATTAEIRRILNVRTFLINLLHHALIYGNNIAAEAIVKTLFLQGPKALIDAVSKRTGKAATISADEKETLYSHDSQVPAFCNNKESVLHAAIRANSLIVVAYLLRQNTFKGVAKNQVYYPTSVMNIFVNIACDTIVLENQLQTVLTQISEAHARPYVAETERAKLASIQAKIKSNHKYTRVLQLLLREVPELLNIRMNFNGNTGTPAEIITSLLTTASLASTPLLEIIKTEEARLRTVRAKKPLSTGTGAFQPTKTFEKTPAPAAGAGAGVDKDDEVTREEPMDRGVDENPTIAAGAGIDTEDKSGNETLSDDSPATGEPSPLFPSHLPNASDEGDDNETALRQAALERQLTVTPMKPVQRKACVTTNANGTGEDDDEQRHNKAIRLD